MEQFDPHTNYLDPDVKQKFDESMTGSMEGIGAQLRKKIRTQKLPKLFRVDPCYETEANYENGDIILKVAQGNEQPGGYCRHAIGKSALK